VTVATRPCAQRRQRRPSGRAVLLRVETGAGEIVEDPADPGGASYGIDADDFAKQMKEIRHAGYTTGGELHDRLQSGDQ